MRSVFSRLVFLAALSLGATAASAQQPPDEVVLENETTIAIRGFISQDIAEKFKSLLTDKIEVVRIFSGNGHPLAAMEVGRVVRQRDLALYIPNVCTGACAQYVFMAAKKRFTDPQALVGFSTTPSGTYQMTSANSEDDVRSFFARMADTEKKFYAEIGAPEEMLLIPPAMLNPGCYNVVRGSDGKVNDITVSARFQIYIPKKTYLDAQKIFVTGFWPTDADTFRAMMVKQVKPENYRVFSFGGPDAALPAATLAEFKTKLAEIKPCAAPVLVPGN